MRTRTSSRRSVAITHADSADLQNDWSHVLLTTHLAAEDRLRVENRLRHNLMAWMSTVRPDGQPVTVPVWFLVREDETLLLYSQPTSPKLRYLGANPRVSLVLDMCDLGRNIVRIEGIARISDDQAPADQQPEYVSKYLERIGALFETPEHFAEQFSTALIITPTKVLIQ